MCAYDNTVASTAMFSNTPTWQAQVIILQGCIKSTDELAFSTVKQRDLCVILLSGGAKHKYPSPAEIKEVKDSLKYVVLEQSGKWRSHAVIHCCTYDQPLRKVTLDLRTSIAYSNAKDAARMRDAALLTMTARRCNQEHLSGLAEFDLDKVNHVRAIKKMVPEIMDYNRQEHVFLCKTDFLERVGVPKRLGSFTTAVPFGQASRNVPAGAATLPTASTRRLDLNQFGYTLRKSQCNVMLNAPAGYGKSHVIKTVMRPLLERCYQKKGVWFTASTGLTAVALGPNASTLHSMAGIGRGTGTAYDLFQAMPAKAQSRWRDVKVQGWCTLVQVNMADIAWLMQWCMFVDPFVVIAIPLSLPRDLSVAEGCISLLVPECC